MLFEGAEHRSRLRERPTTPAPDETKTAQPLAPGPFQSSEGVLTGSGGCSEGLGLGMSALSRATSIFGIFNRIFATLEDAVDSIGVVDRYSGTSVDRSWLVYVDRCSVPPEHLFYDLLHYVDDPPGHAGLHCCPEQVSKAQPLLAVQYRSISEMECRSMSGEGYRSMECLCCRSIGMSENLSTGLVSGSTVV
ncbi:hypothetical protein F2Q69_00012364 [Brassica cretica]|uniref:Uncharacterized protein n=1 Tax=Brassica cretica TaxID=69181 RepID=A0A8S9R2W5_BRACR|nr:hypothetical protein F2Q69_00012364 [Brassica cretica]